MVMVPENGVSVEISCWIKPEVDSLFPVAFPMSVDIGLHCVRLTTSIPQELKIQLVSYSVGVRIHLSIHQEINQKYVFV